MFIILDKIKEISKTTESEAKLYLYINVATRLIKNYINSKKLSVSDIQKEYEDIIILLVISALDSKNDGIRQLTEGDVSISYFDDKSFRISDDIKALLPLPYIKMR